MSLVKTSRLASYLLTLGHCPSCSPVRGMCHRFVGSTGFTLRPAIALILITLSQERAHVGCTMVQHNLGGPCSVAGHVPTLPWVRSRVWVRVRLGSGQASGKGRVGTWPVKRFDPFEAYCETFPCFFFRGGGGGGWGGGGKAFWGKVWLSPLCSRAPEINQRKYE